MSVGRRRAQGLRSALCDYLIPLPNSRHNPGELFLSHADQSGREVREKLISGILLVRLFFRGKPTYMRDRDFATGF